MLITSNTINELKISRLPQTKSNLQQMKTIILISNKLCQIPPLYFSDKQ
jgi:hypothetical protein